jgi:HK97 gp10 family phage protein
VAKISGDRQHKARLALLRSPEMTREVGKAIYAAGQVIEIEAEIMITKGSISGKGHIPSKPGEPPNADTRLLDTSIETVKTGPLKAEVQSNAPYAVALEKGTSKMAARPVMGPATRKKRSEAVDIVLRTVSRVASKGVSS